MERWASRLPSNTEKGVVSDAEVDERTVRSLVGWFAEWGVPASWLCAESAAQAEALTLDGSGLRLYVARAGGDTVGMASAFRAGDALLLAALGVLPEARRRGVGRALATARLRRARAEGCSHAVLAPSPDGRKLYETLGFTLRRQPTDRWFYLPVG